MEGSHLYTVQTAVRSIRGIAKIENAYHQLRWLILDYGAPVQIPGPEAYLVRDYATAAFRETFNQYPYSDARIVAAYTSDTPSVRDDRTSVPGQYVVLELAVIAGAVLENGIWKPPFNAGVCTWRQAGDGKDWRRMDFSDLLIAQVLPVTMADGTVVEPGPAGTLDAGDVTTLEVQAFTEGYVDFWGGKPLYAAWHLPQGWEHSTGRYPLLVSISGGGGMRVEENGHDRAGGHLTRDRAAAAWLDAGEPVFILTPQIGQEDRADLPETMDRICDLVARFMDKYPIDPDRVYCIGSSYGTLSWSTALSQDRYARRFTAYIQCNGHFNGAASLFLEQYDVRQAEALLGPLTKDFTDFSDPALRKHGAAFFQSDEYREMRQALQAVVDNRVFVDIFHAANDEVAPVDRGITTYLLLHEMYREEGLDEAAIAKLLRLNIIPTQTYHDLGIFSYHQASKVAVSDREVLRHTLSLKKSQLLAVR